jgi:hypothetical protein
MREIDQDRAKFLRCLVKEPRRDLPPLLTGPLGRPRKPCRDRASKFALLGPVCHAKQKPPFVDWLLVVIL